MPTLRDAIQAALNRQGQDTLPSVTVAAGGVYEAPFLSGSIQYNNNGVIDGVGDFQFGFSLPNATGTPTVGLLIGGAGKSQAVIITDAQLPGQTGINLLIEAGDSDSTLGNTDDAGDFLTLGGGSLGGNGGTNTVQGGTSVHGRAGDAVLQGGNTTDGTPGNAIIIAAQTGPVGANVLLIATKPTGSSTFGDVRVQANSTVLIQFLSNGEIYLTASGTGAGLAGQPLVSGGMGAAAKWATNGYTGDIPPGSTIHVASGLITGYT